MKKILVFMLVVIVASSLTACGSKEESNNPSNTTAPAASITLASKEANFTALLVPSDFGDFYDKDGYAIAESENASIIITPTIVPDIRIEEISESYMIDLMTETYSNIKVLSFENPVTIAGVDAVLFQLTGDGATSGKNRTITHLTLFFSINGQDCEQQVILSYDTGTNTSLEANLNEIIASITLN